MVDLADVAPHLLAARPPRAVDHAVATVTEADLLLVASPTYKGTYTGLLKVFFDRLPPLALRGTVALPLLVMAAPHHALAVEVYLRPLLAELGATVPTPGLALLESELARPDEVLSDWAARVAPTVRRLVTAGTTSPTPAPAKVS